jgi:hypothetical protein
MFDDAWHLSLGVGSIELMFDALSVGLDAGESLRAQDELAFRLTVSGLTQETARRDPEWAYEDGRRDVLPDDLESLPPGPGLALVVMTTDRSRVSAYDLVRLLQAENRLISALQAGLYETITEISSAFDDEDGDAAAAEIAAALHLTRSASEHEHALAMRLRRYPQVRAALASGSIDLRRVRVLLDSIRGIDPSIAGEVFDRVIDDAPDLTTGQLRARVNKLCLELEPRAMAGRYRAGIEQRRIVLQTNPDTTANLCGFDLPADLAAAAAQRIDWLARRAKSKHDSRTLDQIRADVYIDLLTGRGHTGSAPAAVDIVVGMETLAGESEEPGHIPGFGPVIAEVARKAVARQTDCKWEFTVTDQGRAVATGTISRRPTTAMKRWIRARHSTCVWPGCRMPARWSDLDHRIPWSQGGSTTLRNLAPLCDKHHSLLDKGWSYEATPDGGHMFTSPLGHTYPSGPDPPR